MDHFQLIHMKKLSCLFLLFLAMRATAQPKLVFPAAHTEKVTIAAFSPDSRRVLTGSGDKTLKLWDVQTGKLLATLKGHGTDIETVVFNKTGTRILSTATLDSFACLWDAHTGSLVRKISNTRYNNELAIFNPAGDRVVVNSSGRPAIFSAVDGTKLTDLEGYDYFDEAIFNAKGTMLFTGGSSGIILYEPATGKRLGKMKGSPPLAQSADGNLIYTGSFDNAIHAWDAATGDSVFTIKQLEQNATSIFPSPRGDRLVVFSIRDSRFTLYDVLAKRKIASLAPGYSSDFLQFSSGGDTVFISSYSGTTAWRTSDGAPIAIPSSLRLTRSYGDAPVFFYNEKDERVQRGIESVWQLENAESLSFVTGDASGRFVFGTPGDQPGSIWSLETGRKWIDLKGLQFNMEESEVTSGLDFFRTRINDRDALWTFRNELIVPDASPRNENAEHIVFSPDGRYMLTVTEDPFRTFVEGYATTHKLSLWEAKTGKLIRDQVWTPEVTSLFDVQLGSHIFSDDGTKFFVSDHNGGSYIFESATGNLLQSIRHDRLWYATVDPAFRRMVQQKAPMDFNEPATISVWDLQKGEKLNELNVDVMGWEKIRFIKGSNHFLVFDNRILVFAEKGKKPVMTMPNGRNELDSLQQRILVYQYDTVGIWDIAKTKRGIILTPGENLSIWSATWSPDERNIVYSENNGRVNVVDAISGQSITRVDCHATSFRKSANGKWLFAIYRDSVSVIDVSNYRVVCRLAGHENDVENVFALPGDAKVVSIAKDNTARIWELATGRLLYTYLVMGSQYEFGSIPSGYYMASPSAARILHFVTPSLDVISFDQLDLQWNRPDRVLAGVGNNDKDLVDSYYQAWLKRVRLIGVDTSRFNNEEARPAVTIVNRKELPAQSVSNEVSIVLKAGDDQHPLQSLNVWVNDVPLYGRNGLRVLGNRLDTTLGVALADGLNRIEISVTNKSGLESYRQPVEILHTGKSVSRIYFVGLGVEKFNDPKYNLQYSVKDIRDLAAAFAGKYGSNLIVDTLFNEQLTLASLKNLKKKLALAGINDRIILAYSGHGLLDEDFDYYLSTSRVNFEKPQQEGILYEEFENLLDGLTARKKLVLIDACHSGEVDRDELRRMDQSADSLVKGLKPVAYKENSHLGLQNSFELMQSLFANVTRSTGAVIISAAAGNQFALERNDLRNGVFSYAILEMLENLDTMTVMELKERVGKRVKEITGGLQQPTSRGADPSVDWSLW
jgi:WD40 repeat protein